mmetsp:Transcript_19989/g.49852  ORF Transcript_19989/g.49852 Transcript_19989/m.49852 type:complete len:97 (+) Transcript_19989:873-1163(+)
MALTVHLVAHLLKEIVNRSQPRRRINPCARIFFFIHATLKASRLDAHTKLLTILLRKSAPRFLMPMLQRTLTLRRCPFFGSLRSGAHATEHTCLRG